MPSKNIGGLGIKCEKQKNYYIKIQKTLADLGTRIDFLNINCIFLREKYIIFTLIFVNYSSKEIL